MPTGIITSHELTSGVIVDIDPMIRLLSPHETPLQSGVGSDGNTVLAMDSCYEKKVEWQDDTLLTPQSTLNGAITDLVTTITVATGEQLRFQPGDVIQIGAEQMRVTAYGAGADELDVTRGFGGTTAAAAADGAVVKNLGAALPEGSDAPDARAEDRTRRHNLTQIFGPDSVQASGTTQAIKKYGIATTEFDYQSALRFKEQVIKCEHALLYGNRFEDTTNKWRTMGGLNFYIQTNVDSATTTLTDTALVDQIEACWTQGGNPNRLLAGGPRKRQISGFDSDKVRLGRGDNGRGEVVEWIDTDFGRVDMVLHRWVRATDLFLFNREQAIIRSLRPWQFKMLADTGDSTKGMIVSEKTLQFEAERYAARFTALA